MDEVRLNIKTYQYNAFADYIIKDHPDYEKWLYSNFIQVVGLDSDKICVDYYCGNVFGQLPLLKVTDHSAFINQKKHSEIIDIIENGILNGKRYYCYLDSYWVKGRKSYKKRHYIHDVLISETNNEDFIYIENISGYYKLLKLNKLLFSHNICNNGMMRMFELSVNNKKTYEFNIKNICIMLNDYLKGNGKFNDVNIYFDDSDYYYRDFFKGKERIISHYGLQVYKKVREVSLEKARNNDYIDYRMIYFLLEKNEIMKKRLDYVINSSDMEYSVYESIKMDLEEVCCRIKKCLFIVLKYNYKRNYQIVEDIFDELELIEMLEKNTYENILKLFELNIGS